MCRATQFGVLCCGGAGTQRQPLWAGCTRAFSSSLQIPHPRPFPLSHKYLPSDLSKHPQKDCLMGAFQGFQVTNGIYIVSVFTVLLSPTPKQQFPLNIPYRFLISAALSRFPCFHFSFPLFSSGMGPALVTHLPRPFCCPREPVPVTALGMGVLPSCLQLDSEHLFLPYDHRLPTLPLPSSFTSPSLHP